eukprot:TRINITY_DN109661_c0_g1_i1.p1 TRINITY_DN109661_c0_g1~~TRINITY_DN109661_c0_g1_i1.p1  ORF type:complete len:351 (+),score=57.14 TRINITY_DN109661_c0_g1_i1:87-1139(+)
MKMTKGLAYLFSTLWLSFWVSAQSTQVNPADGVPDELLLSGTESGNLDKLSDEHQEDQAAHKKAGLKTRRGRNGQFPTVSTVPTVTGESVASMRSTLDKIRNALNPSANVPSAKAPSSRSLKKWFKKKLDSRLKTFASKWNLKRQIRKMHRGRKQRKLKKKMMEAVASVVIKAKKGAKKTKKVIKKMKNNLKKRIKQTATRLKEKMKKYTKKLKAHSLVKKFKRRVKMAKIHKTLTRSVKAIKKLKKRVRTKARSAAIRMMKKVAMKKRVQKMKKSFKNRAGRIMNWFRKKLKRKAPAPPPPRNLPKDPKAAAARVTAQVDALNSKLGKVEGTVGDMAQDLKEMTARATR